jgi:spore maturation protein CgeB
MGHQGIHLGTAGSFSHSWLAHQSARVLFRVPAYVRQRQQAIVKAAERCRPELVINLEGQLLPETVADVKRSAGKIVLWFPDAVVNLGRMLMFLAPYDALFFKEPHLVERCQAMLGIDVHYLPEACNTRWHRPPASEGPRDRHIVVAGNIYGYRAVLLERLIDDGIPVSIYGGPIASFIGHPRVRRLHTGEFISRERKAEVFHRAAAVLNSMHPGEFKGMNCRLFEATASGALVVTEHRAELPQFFDTEKEVVAYSTYQELVEQLKWALTEPAEGGNLRLAASVRAHGEHTYELRLTELLARVT